jgi:hypothetical protein
MSAGKGDTPRAVNGDLYRRNYDAIFSRRSGANFLKEMEEEDAARRKAYSELRGISVSSVVTITQKTPVPPQRKPYPSWICDECGRLHGKRPEGNPYGATWHIDECGVCGTGGVEVTEPRDFGHLREGWDE